MSARDIEAEGCTATRTAALPELSPFGPAAMERAAKSAFIEALRVPTGTRCARHTTAMTPRLTSSPGTAISAWFERER
jgi:hypothetical protein